MIKHMRRMTIRHCGESIVDSGYHTLRARCLTCQYIFWSRRDSFVCLKTLVAVNMPQVSTALYVELGKLELANFLIRYPCFVAFEVVVRGALASPMLASTAAGI